MVLADVSKVKAVAFDLDGTLVDSALDLTVAVQDCLSELGLPLCSEEQVRLWIGNGAEVLMHRALMFATSADVEETRLAEVMPRFKWHYQQNLQKHSRLYAGVLAVLGRLHDSGIRLAIVTNKPYAFTVPLLAGFGLSAFFSLVLGGDSLDKMKPDPQPLLHLMHEWGLKEDEIIMVGDSKNDILAAKAAGIGSIGLTYGYNYGEDIALSCPNAVCHQLNDILPLIL
ncbi:phosphoglycolate phosphatase [Shewanella surugensis]|uniref:Phosphoglycolate phosphatase n=1 Tax=Shewanella surugensis TaxID=212020 RepID=A0ABT0LD31_9GAMM|nr:phosphoglycolate phosphatase [Shewanella surugensis]MCL1125570.1 phosphoglycolate phosphatase [Shewanella surugensis]